MGAVGVLLCWIATLVVLPAMIFVSDRRAQGTRARQAPLSLALLGRLLVRRPGRLVALSALFTAVSIYGLLHFTAQPFEYDFRRLNARIPVSDTTRQFNTSQDALFGRWPQPTIVLADRLDQVQPVRESIRRQDAAVPGPDVIGQVI